MIEEKATLPVHLNLRDKYQGVQMPIQKVLEIFLFKKNCNLKNLNP